MLALRKNKTVIHISIGDDKTGIFTSNAEYDLDGNYLSGDKQDLTPERVRFLAWRQKQSPALSDKKLELLWITLQTKEGKNVKTNIPLSDLR